MARRSVTISKNLVTLEYEGRQVHITDDLWINATEKAEHYGKRLDHWLASKETKAYMEALSRALKYPKSGDLVIGKRGRNGGTWLHPKLGVAFARWLNPDFAVWLDLQNDAMLRGTHPFSNPPRTDVLTEKRQAHNPMMRELMEFRAEQGKDTETHHYTTENRLCNWAVFGEFKTRDESTMSNDDLTLLGKVREHNTHLIAAGTEYAERKPMLNRFATRMRTRMIGKARGAGLNFQPSDGL